MYKKLSKKFFLLIIVGLLLQTTATTAATSKYNQSVWKSIKKNLRLQRVTRKPQVKAYIKHYQQDPYHIRVLGKRAAPYLYFIKQQVIARKMPAELVFLPMIESAYQPFAESKVGAIGLWQINAVTGEHFGITTDEWTDNRRDITIATNTALNYLAYLHKKYDDDWLLALAAYNAGPRTVNRAIARNRDLGKKTDYWSLDLPRQTKQFVPKLLAISHVMTHYKKLKITVPHIANQPYFVAVNLNKQIHLQLAADAADMQVTELQHLNPSIKQLVTHPTGPHKLLIPVTQANNFLSKIQNVLKQYKSTWYNYKILPGDSLIKITKNHSQTIALIKNVNNIKGNLIIAGKTILIPHTS